MIAEQLEIALMAEKLRCSVTQRSWFKLIRPSSSIEASYRPQTFLPYTYPNGYLSIVNFHEAMIPRFAPSGSNSIRPNFVVSRISLKHNVKYFYLLQIIIHNKNWKYSHEIRNVMILVLLTCPNSTNLFGKTTFRIFDSIFSCEKKRNLDDRVFRPDMQTRLAADANRSGRATVSRVHLFATKENSFGTNQHSTGIRKIFLDSNFMVFHR